MYTVRSLTVIEKAKELAENRDDECSHTSWIRSCDLLGYCWWEVSFVEMYEKVVSVLKTHRDAEKSVCHWHRHTHVSHLFYHGKKWRIMQIFCRKINRSD